MNRHTVPVTLSLLATTCLSTAVSDFLTVTPTTVFSRRQLICRRCCPTFTPKVPVSFQSAFPESRCNHGSTDGRSHCCCPFLRAHLSVAATPNVSLIPAHWTDTLIRLSTSARLVRRQHPNDVGRPSRLQRPIAVRESLDGAGPEGGAPISPRFTDAAWERRRWTWGIGPSVLPAMECQFCFRASKPVTTSRSSSVIVVWRRLA